MLTYFEKGFGERRWFCGNGAVIEGESWGGWRGDGLGLLFGKKGIGTWAGLERSFFLLKYDFYRVCFFWKVLEELIY